MKHHKTSHSYAVLVLILSNIAQLHALILPVVVPHKNGDQIEDQYLKSVQSQEPDLILAKDYSRNFLTNGDFGAETAQWDKVLAPTLRFAKGDISHQNLSIQGRMGSGIAQDFTERLDDFIYVSQGRVNSKTGILLRFQGYLQGLDRDIVKLAVITKDKQQKKVTEQSIHIDRHNKLYTTYFKIDFSGDIEKAYFVFASPASGRHVRLERITLKAIAPISKDISLGESYPRWMTFRNGTDLRVADILANGRAKITHALRPSVVKTLKEFEATQHMLHIDHDNFMNQHVHYKQRAWKVGARVLNALTPSSTKIEVEAPRHYGGKIKEFWAITGGFKTHRVLYTLKDDGSPNMDSAELVSLSSSHKNGKKSNNGHFVVKRNVDGTKARSFPKGKTFIADLAKAFHDPAHPKINEYGKSTKDVIVESYQKKFEAIPWKGVEFDTAHWFYLNDADTNHDFAPDRGVIKGINTAALGAIDIMEGLRGQLGHDFIIQTDGDHPSILGPQECKVGFKSFEWINGVEEESYSPGNSSSSFEYYRHLQELIRFNPIFNYPLNKDVTARYNPPELAAKGATDDIFKASLATACILGMVQSFHPHFNDLDDAPDHGVFYYWDEYYGGELQDESWLGRPLGPAMQDPHQLKAKNLIENVRWTTSSSSLDQDDISFHFQHPSPSQPISLNIKKTLDGSLDPKDITIHTEQPLSNKLIKAGKVYTWKFKARAQDWIEYGGKVYKNIPMHLFLSLSPQDKPESVALISGDWRLYTISFIARPDLVSFKDAPYKQDLKRYLNPKKEGQKRGDDFFVKKEKAMAIRNSMESIFQPTLSIGAQTGKIEFKDVALYEGDDAYWYREFENGLVLHNTGALPWTFKVPKGFRKLKSANQQSYNSGEDMSDKKVTLNNGESLFLTRNSSYHERLKRAKDIKGLRLKPNYYKLGASAGEYTRLTEAQSHAIREGSSVKIKKKSKKKRKKN